LYNFVEHGKSPLLPVPELAALGFKIVIFPGSIMLSVCTLAQRVLREIRQHGTTAKLLEEMLSVQDFFEIMELQELLALDARWAENRPVTRSQ
jgi:2-methylisocitrate lyase-like PEP mutase family enzyme